MANPQQGIMDSARQIYKTKKQTQDTLPVLFRSSASNKNCLTFVLPPFGHERGERVNVEFGREATRES
jgi:hypothetical protein